MSAAGAQRVGGLQVADALHPGLTLDAGHAAVFCIVPAFVRRVVLAVGRLVGCPSAVELRIAIGVDRCDRRGCAVPLPELAPPQMGVVIDAAGGAPPVSKERGIDAARFGEPPPFPPLNRRNGYVRLRELFE